MNLTDAIFTDPTKAREHLEATRWPHGPVCPHCGVVNEATALKGKAHRAGVYQCNGCREQFTVTVGMVFERSKIPLNKWLLASYLMASSKKGVSAHQLHRTLGITYKSAWFMAHRLREAMTETDPALIGGGGKTIEVDETFIGKQETTFVNGKGWVAKPGVAGMRKIVTLVERGGRARSIKVDNLRKAEIDRVMRQASRMSVLNTDQAKHYFRFGKEFIAYKSVDHSKDEYGRLDRDGRYASTNTVEGFFSIFKRGMKGIYQHCSEQHLQRYLAEYDFRYSNRVALGIDDAMRADELLRGIGGKRLTYRRTNEARYA